MNWYKYALQWDYEPFVRDYDIMQEREDYAKSRPQKEMEKEIEVTTENDDYIMLLLDLANQGLRVPQITQRLREEGYDVSHSQVAKALIAGGFIDPENIEDYFD